MRGGSLTRYRPDDYQGGRGFLKDLASSSLRSGWQGLKRVEWQDYPLMSKAPFEVSRAEENAP